MRWLFQSESNSPYNVKLNFKSVKVNETNLKVNFSLANTTETIPFV